MTKNKKKLRRAERRYSVSRTAQTLVLTGLLLAGGVGSAMAAPEPYDGTSNFEADKDYNATTGGPADTVVVSKDGAVAFDKTGVVTISAIKGLEINGTAASGTGTKLTVGTAAGEILTITSGALTLTAGDATTGNDATLTIDGEGAEVRLLDPETEATITGVQGTAGLSTINVTKGTLGAYDAKGDVADLTISGPIAVDVTASTGILAAAGLTLDGKATLTNANEVTIDGVGGNNKFASLDISDGSNYVGDIEVDNDSHSPALEITGSTLNGKLSVLNGEVLLQKAEVTGDVTMTGGSIAIKSIVSQVKDETTLDSLTIGGTDDAAGNPLHGGMVTVDQADLVVTEALTVNHDFAEFTLKGNATLTADSLEVSKGFVDLQGTAKFAEASAITDGGLLWVSGATTMTEALTVGDTANPGGSVDVRQGGTLHLKEDSTTLGSGHLQVRQGGILKLDANKTLTVAGNPVDSPSAGMGRNVVLYDASGFTAATGSIAGKVDVTSGELAFATAVDLTDILIDGGTSSAANGKITIGADKNDAGEVAARQGLTYNKSSLSLGHADATLMSGNFQLASTGDFTMTKGTLMAIGDLKVGDGSGKLTLTADSSLNLVQAASETITVGAGKIDVATGNMNVLLGNWAVDNVDVGTSGSLNVGELDPAKGGVAGLTINGELNTLTGGGDVSVVNGNLNLLGTVKTDVGDITASAGGVVNTNASVVLLDDFTDLATDVGQFAVNDTGLLTIKTSAKDMSIDDYKTLKDNIMTGTGTLRLDGVNITGVTESTKLDDVDGVSVAGNVVAIDASNTVGNFGTEVKGLKGDGKAGATVTVNGGLTIVGDSNADFKLSDNGNFKTNITVSGASNQLNLGSAGSDYSYGNLNGSVTLGNATAALNATKGTFTVGAVDGSASNQGIVKAQGASLTAESIGETFAVASVEANSSGTLSSLGGIVTQTLTANGGLVKAKGDIEVTNKVTGLSDGLIWSETGNVTLTAGATTASGIIEASKGSITTSNADITGTDLVLTAGADINVGSGNIEATTVSAKAGTITAADVTATTLQAKTLTAAGNVELTDGKFILTGADTTASTVGGTLDLNNIQASVGDLSVTGLATIKGGVFLGDKVTLTAGGTIDKGAQVGIKDLTLADDLTVGNADKTESGNTFLKADKTTIAGNTLQVQNATAHLGTLADGTTGKIFVDPAYVNITSVGANFGGSLLAGAQGVITIGDVNEAWVKKAIIDAKAPSDSSVLGIQKSIVLGTGSIVVDKDVNGQGIIGNAVSAPSQKVYFGNKSLLAIDGSQFLDSTKNAAIVGSTSTIFIQKTGTEQARLHITNVKTNDTVHVLSGVTGVDTTATAGNNVWNNNNISFDTQLFYGEGATNAASTTYNVKVNSRGAGNIFPSLSTDMAGLVDNVMAQYGLQTGSNNAGVRFVSRAVSDSYGLGGSNAERAAATIEGAAQLAVVGAAPAMTISAATAGTSAATTRTSFATPLMDSTKAVALHQSADGSLSLDSGVSAGDSMKTGLGVWIMPLYQSNNVWGMKSGDFKGGYTSDLGGVALGADYTIDDSLRFGLAFNLGGGYAQSKGDFNSTDNSFNFWGINLYGGWTQNNFGLSGDVGYTSTYNKMKQELPSAMQMGDIKSDVTSRAWTAGLRGEYKFATEALDIIPHVGVRYLGLTTDDYKAKSNGDTVFKADESFQNIWTFPVGLTFTKEMTNSSGWSFRPQLDLGVTPAAGDVKAKSRVRIPGVDGSAEMKMQVMDYISYDGGVGLEMKKDNVSFGVNYNIQASEHRTGHGVFGTFRYEF